MKQFAGFGNQCVFQAVSDKPFGIARQDLKKQVGIIDFKNHNKLMIEFAPGKIMTDDPID
jgi:hypothetical protein